MIYLGHHRTLLIPKEKGKVHNPKRYAMQKVRNQKHSKGGKIPGKGVGYTKGRY